MKETREFETTPLWRFIWPAALLHAALIGAAALVPVRSTDSLATLAARLPGREAAVEVDLQVVSRAFESTERRAPRSARVSPSSGDSSSGTRPLAHLSRATLRRGNTRATERRGEPGAADLGAGAARESVPPGSDGAGEGGKAGPTLSLEQLGVGLGEGHAAVTPYPRAPHSRPSARRRLQRSMASALEARDRAHGLGAHGKVIQALEVAARTETTAPNGRADFLVVVDDRGRVASIEVVSVSGAFRAWKRAAQQARRALAGYRVPLPEGAQGLQIQLEIASRVQRPSGRDPDIAVSLFGIPLNQVEGDKPSKVEVFNPIPKLQWVDVPDPATGETHELPVVQLMFVPLLLGFDPADLGAPTRRVVSGRVVDVNVL